MANNNQSNDATAFLVGLGILALVGAGVYKIIKVVAQYEEAVLLDQQQALQLAQAYVYIRQPNCDRHGSDAELCNSCKQCIECRGGIGDAANRWCNECDDDFYAS